MPGTKMTLHRYGGRSVDFDEQQIVIDQAYIDQYGDQLIHLDFSYEVGKKLLQVYFNGQRLANGDFEEVDAETIKLNLGTDEEGNPIGLEPDDVLLVRKWKNHYVNDGGYHPSGVELLTIHKRIEELTHYGGAVNVDMEYVYNDKKQIIEERSSGAHTIVRKFKYNHFDEIIEEQIIEDDHLVIKTFEYDDATQKLTRSAVRVVR